MDNDFSNVRFLPNKEQTPFSPYLFVETYFERDKEMVIVMALCENQRRLRLSERVNSLEDDQLKTVLGEVIRFHYKASGKKVSIFGDIQSYKYFYKPNQAWLFDVTGQYLDDIKEQEPDKAEAFTDENGKREPLGYELS